MVLEQFAQVKAVQLHLMQGPSRNWPASASGGAPVGASGGDAIENLASGGDTGATLLQATREMQEMSQQFNLQYLQLQQNMQNENRKFSALSNVMKTKHDSQEHDSERPIILTLHSVWRKRRGPLYLRVPRRLSFMGVSGYHLRVLYWGR